MSVEFITLSTTSDNELVIENHEPANGELVYMSQDRETGMGTAVIRDAHGRYQVEEFDADFGHSTVM